MTTTTRRTTARSLSLTKRMATALPTRLTRPRPKFASRKVLQWRLTSSSPSNLPGVAIHPSVYDFPSSEAAVACLSKFFARETFAAAYVNSGDDSDLESKVAGLKICTPQSSGAVADDAEAGLKGVAAVASDGIRVETVDDPFRSKSSSI